MPKKISQLPSAVSVSGSDTACIVQGGTTKKATIDQLMASMPLRPQVVATRCAVSNASWGNGAGGRSDTRVENRQKYLIGCRDVSQLRVAINGFYISSVSGESSYTADFLYEAAIELSSPATYQRAYTQGLGVSTVSNGIPYVTSDPVVGFDLPAGGSFWLRQSCSVDSTSKNFPGGSTPIASNDTGFVSASASSQVAATGNMTQPSGGAAFGGPHAALVLGMPSGPMAAVAYLGDSIADGTGDGVDSLGNTGFIARGLASVNSYPVPWLKQTVGGWTFAKCTIDTAPRLRALWPYVTHLVCQLGTNDIAAGTSLASLQSYATALWTSAKRTIGPYGKPLKTAQVLIMPRTTSTDSWASAANQTPVSGFGTGGVREQFNNWVLAQAGGGLLDSAINVNQYVEDGANPGKWVTNGSANYPTSDGIHPSAAAHLLAAQAVNSWALGINP